MLAAVRWTLAIAWASSPALVLGVLGLALAYSTVSAGLAVTARGLINVAVSESRSGHPQLAPLLPWLLAGLGFGLIEGLAPLASAHAVRRLASLLQLRVAIDVFTHASRLTPAETEDARRRGLLDQARDAAARQLTRLLTELITVTTGLAQCALLAGVLFHIEPVTLAIAIPGAALYLYAESRATRLHHAGTPGRALKQRWTRYYSGLLTGERSASHVRLLGLAPLLIERFRGLSHELEAGERARAREQLGSGAAFALLTTCLFSGLLALVTIRAVQGRLTVGDIAVFAAASARLRTTISRLVAAVSRALDAALASEGIRSFLAIRPEPALPAPAAPVAPAAGVDVEDVWFTYPGAAKPALAGVSFSIRPGEILVLTGDNGAGKTTLVKLLAGLCKPDRGRVLLDGRDLREWPFETLRERLAVVSHESPRFEATARDNVAFGWWHGLGHAPEAVEDAARQAGVHDLLQGLPRGYETTIGPLFGEHDLSAGLWQQLVLARVLARPASLWLLDEPTAHLDDRTEGEMLSRIRALASGRSVLLVSHRPRSLALADRIVVLERGRVVEAGARPELLAHGGRSVGLAVGRDR
jgi:ATP-binding cassette subfamily B protein